MAARAHNPFINVGAYNTTPAGDWRIENQINRITGAPVSNAMLTSRMVSNSTFVVAPVALLQFACSK